MEIFIIFLILVFVGLIIKSIRNKSGKNYTVDLYSNKYDKQYNSSRNYTIIPQPKRYDERLDAITSPDRGTRSERNLISSLLDHGIAPKSIFHDLYVKNGKYGFSQIDIVVATKVGLIVFEVKDYAGWIFGKGRQNQWTQVLNYGNHKYRFYNPVLQNESHIKVLQKQSKQFAKLPFYSVVVFCGNSELRDISFIPDGTFVIKPHRLGDVLDIIFDNSNAEYTDKREVMSILKSAVNNGNDTDTQTEHVEKIKDMLGKDRVLN